MESSQDGPVIVYDVDEQEETRTPVFEGSPQEAQAYMEQRRSEGENFLVPALIIVAGALLVVVALIPLLRLRKHA